jgi:ABC-type antimicrobial peptide transport system ATPase subunit
MLGMSVPHYWIGMVLVIIFSVHLGWWASRANVIRDAIIPGAPPALSEPPRACSFAPRCRFAELRCVAAPPDMILNKGRLVRCILAEPAAP